MTPDHGPLLYEGKAKRVFCTNEEERLLVEFKNDATAFNALKRAELKDKGRLNCQISARLFERLEEANIPNHYLGLSGENWMMVKRVEIIPLEVVIRNVAAGSLCRESPIALGTKLIPELLDIYYKDDTLADPLLTEARLEILDLLSSQQRIDLGNLALKVNQCLKPFFEELGLLLVDFKLELGVDYSGQLVVADEISPDTCRLWDLDISDANDRILDKDRFRKDLGGVIEAYGEIFKRVQGVCTKPRNYK